MIVDILVSWFMLMQQPSIPWNVPIDLRSQFPVTYDQGSLQSCVSNAVVSVHEFYEKNSRLSRLDLYYQSRRIKQIDKGSSISDTMRVMNTDGVCTENLWPYTPWNTFRSPPIKCTSQRRQSRLRPLRLPSSSFAVEYALRHRHPVIIGTQLPLMFFVSDTITKKGVMNESDMKRPDILVSRHAMVAVGITNDKTFIIRNSWGSRWGNRGHVSVPYSFIDRYVLDSWILFK